MTKGQRMAQRKGQEPSEEPETLREARESCMEEEAVKFPGAWAGVGWSERPGEDILGREKRSIAVTQSK